MLAFTSGTTGRPKATMHFHRDVMSICETFSRHVLRPSSDDVFTGTPPYAFTFGLGGVLLFPLHAGASTLLVEKATPVELAGPDRRARRDDLLHRAHGVQGDARRRRGPCRPCGKAVSAGEHLPKATWEAFRDATGVEIIDGIGATEMLHIFISASGDRTSGPARPGRAVPGYAATDRRRRRQRAAAGRARAARRARADRLPLPRRPTPARLRRATAGTSPATRSSATTTATSGTRPAATT